MATTPKTDAQKVAELRKQAMDKSLPQEVRDMADKKANAIEGKSVEKATGMKLAKGGAVKKMMYGGAVPNTPRDKQSQMKQLKATKAAKPNMLSASAFSVPSAEASTKSVQKQVQTKPLPNMAKPKLSSDPLSNFAVSKTRMAKGGSVKNMMYGGMAEKPMMAKGGDAKKMMMGGAVAKDLPMRGQRTATNMAKGGAAMKAKKK
jgi:hypothetical protein